MYASAVDFGFSSVYIEELSPATLDNKNNPAFISFVFSTYCGCLIETVMALN